MSIPASLLRAAYRISSAKKAFALPEDQLLKAIRRANRGRGFFMPTDRKAHYEKKMINGFPCLIVRADETPAKRAILFFFGGGMVIGPDKGDAAVLRRLCHGTGCDVWFPVYPLCTEHCITESYDMAYACYRQIIGLYGGGNVSTCGFSSGAALALGMAAHNSALGIPLPQSRRIVAVAPSEVPWNDEERARMQALNPRDVAIDYAFMAKSEKLMRHGQDNVPEYMLAPSRGDYSGVGGIQFYYSKDEGALRRAAGVPGRLRARGRALYRHRAAGNDALLLHVAVFPGGKGGFRQDRGVFEEPGGKTMILQVLLEGLGLGALLFLVCAFGIRNGAVGMVHLYAPEVQARCVELGLTTHERIRRNAALFKAVCLPGYIALCARLRVRRERRAGLLAGLLAAACHPVGHESHRSVPDRRFLGGAHKGMDDPRYGGSEAVYQRERKAEKVALWNAWHGGHFCGAFQDHADLCSLSAARRKAGSDVLG